MVGHAKSRYQRSTVYGGSNEDCVTLNCSPARVKFSDRARARKYRIWWSSISGPFSFDASQGRRLFKFSLVAAVAAYLINAPSVIIPESGQGALAPAMLPMGQGYADFRNHPAFTFLMEKFVDALFGHRLRYNFPRPWMTKGETLREFVDNCGAEAAKWAETRSCWQQLRQASVAGARRQCGICAACMLRRLSVHAAGLSERNESHV